MINLNLSFFLNEISNCNPHRVSFDDQSSPGSGTIAKRLWDFGDGNVSSEQHPSHTYTTTGIFDVTLKVTNSYGCVSGETKSDAALNERIEADFSVDIADECHALPGVKFNNNSVGAGFAQNIYGLLETAIHLQQLVPSINTVPVEITGLCLKCKTSAGCFDTISKEVVMSSKQSSFSIAGTLCTDEQLLFQNTVCAETHCYVCGHLETEQLLPN